MGRYPKKDDNYIEFPRTERLDLRKKRSDRTRSNILNSALRCFANAGYSATSIQDIVDDAEYTKPTLYYYFSSKSDLFTALTLHALDEHRATLEKEFQATSDLKEALINIILKLSKEAHSKTSLTRLIISSFFSADKEIPCKKKFIEESSRIIDIYTAFIEKKLNDGSLQSTFPLEMIVRTVYSWINSILVDQLMYNKPAITRNDADTLLTIILMGIQNR